MIEPINDFVKRSDTTISLDEQLLVKKENRYFLLSENLKRTITKDFFYAGICLGQIRDGKFLPSFSLLRMMAEQEGNKVVVDEKTEWLFICGRDIFRQGILRAEGSEKRGSYTLVLNGHSECLGFGEILRDLGIEGEGVAIKNVLDIGDFLRRER